MVSSKISWVLKTIKEMKNCRSTYLWVPFFRGAKYESTDARKREIEGWMTAPFDSQSAHLYDEEIAEKLHAFLEHVVEHKLLEEIREKIRAYPRIPLVGPVAIIDKVVIFLLRKQSRDLDCLDKWETEVVGTWYISGNQTPRAFLLRANKFLRRHVDQETELSDSDIRHNSEQCGLHTHDKPDVAPAL